MLVVTADLPYSDWQVARETTGTETLLSLAGRDELPSEVVPLLNPVSIEFQLNRQVLRVIYQDMRGMLTSRRW